MADTMRISDPERIRALTHPIRLELLDYLGDVREATATECAEHIGESVASCSFHLRTLERYGYIERAEQRGREKPWRVAHASMDMRPDPEQPGSLRAMQELAVLSVERESERLRRYYGRDVARESDPWVQATTLMRSTFWATRAELAELSAEIQRITDRFAGRNEDPALRPAGARRANLFAAVNPDPIDDAASPEEGRDDD